MSTGQSDDISLLLLIFVLSLAIGTVGIMKVKILIAGGKTSEKKFVNEKYIDPAGTHIDDFNHNFLSGWM